MLRCTESMEFTFSTEKRELVLPHLLAMIVWAFSLAFIYLIKLKQINRGFFVHFPIYNWSIPTKASDPSAVLQYIQPWEPNFQFL